jgi:hypothetical protein
VTAWRTISTPKKLINNPSQVTIPGFGGDAGGLVISANHARRRSVDSS